MKKAVSTVMTLAFLAMSTIAIMESTLAEEVSKQQKEVVTQEISVDEYTMPVYLKSGKRKVFNGGERDQYTAPIVTKPLIGEEVNADDYVELEWENGGDINCTVVVKDENGETSEFKVEGENKFDIAPGKLAKGKEYEVIIDKGGVKSEPYILKVERERTPEDVIYGIDELINFSPVIKSPSYVVDISRDVEIEFGYKGDKELKAFIETELGNKTVLEIDQERDVAIIRANQLTNGRYTIAAECCGVKSDELSIDVVGYVDPEKENQENQSEQDDKSNESEENDNSKADSSNRGKTGYEINRKYASWFRDDWDKENIERAEERIPKDEIIPGGVFASAAEASSHMETIDIDAWDLDSNGELYSKKISLTVNKALSETYKKVFSEIYDIQFPIHSLGCYNYRRVAGSSRLSEHAYGTAVDINPNENYMIYSTGNSVGSLYKPYENPYSVTKEVVNIFRKYNFGWGASFNDYMHFSYFGT